MEGSIHAAARPAVAVIVLAGFLALATPTFADPGSPGLTRATEGVYTGTEESFGEAELGVGDEDETESTAQSVPRAARPAVADGTGLPFTGLAAPAMLMAGLIALSIGLAIRRAARDKA